MNLRLRLRLPLFFLLIASCAALSVGVNASTAMPAETDLRVEVVVPEGAAYAVMDVLDGVEARYRTMANGDVYGEYSCAGYVKAYYAAVYNVNVQNLMDAGPPHPAHLFVRVQTPQKGDIIFYATPPNRNNHSAIVKSFDGARITLIEQNFKWAQDGGTYTYLNRTIPFPSPLAGEPVGEDEYEIWRLASAETLPVTEPEDTLPVFNPEPEPPLTEAPPVEEIPIEALPPVTEESPLAEPPPFEDIPPIAEAPITEELPPLTEAPHYEAAVTIGRMFITVNGLDMPIEAPALIENSRAVMPVRFVSYALGLNNQDLFWDEYSRTVTVNNNGNVIIFAVDSNVIFVNNNPQVMDCAAFVRGNYTYLPLKYLAEALNVSYVWNDAERTVKFFK